MEGNEAKLGRGQRQDFLGKNKPDSCVPRAVGIWTYNPPATVRVHVTQHRQGLAVLGVDGVPSAQGHPTGQEFLAVFDT